MLSDQRNFSAISVTVTLGAATFFSGLVGCKDGSNPANSTGPATQKPLNQRSPLTEWQLAVRDLKAPIPVTEDYLNQLILVCNKEPVDEDKVWRFVPSDITACGTLNLIEQLDLMSYYLSGLVEPVRSYTVGHPIRKEADLFITAYNDQAALFDTPEFLSRWREILPDEKPDWKPQCKEHSTTFVAAIFARLPDSTYRQSGITLTLVAGAVFEQAEGSGEPHQWVECEGVIYDPSILNGATLTAVQGGDLIFDRYVPAFKCEISLKPDLAGKFVFSKKIFQVVDLPQATRE